MIISYDPTLILLSLFVAITGTITGLTLTTGYDLSHKYNAAMALIKGAVVIGGSVWLAHFMALLAIRFPIPVTYRFVEAMVSLYVAIFGAGVGLFVARGQRFGIASNTLGGAFMGSAIVIMHYMGMLSLRGVSLEQTGTGVIATSLIAVMASIAALWLAFRKRGIAETLGGGMLLGLTVAAVHFTALGTTVFHFIRQLSATTAPLMPQSVMAFVVAAGTSAVCGVFLYMFAKLALSGVPERRFAQPGTFAQPNPFEQPR
jgi:diguanylate cyclase